MPKPEDEAKASAASATPGAQQSNAGSSGRAMEGGGENAASAAAGSQGAASRTAPETSKSGAQGATQDGGAKGKTASATASDAVSLLKQDHRKVEGLFAEFEKADDDRKQEIIEEACQELIIHTALEEKIFYRAAEELDEDKADEAQVEHDAAKVLILELMDGDERDQYREAKFKVLAEEIKHHVKEEEAPDGLFAKAQKAGVNTRELGQRLMNLKQQLLQRAQAGQLPEPRPVSFEVVGEGSRQERSMPSYRDRDEEGRFTSDDRGYRSRGRDDDDRGRRSYASHDRPRDARGRFTDDDDDRGYRSRSSSSSRDRGQGGWFGDSEGHSEASRRGWDERDRGESRSYAHRRDDDGDDRGYRSRGSSPSRDRGRGGWFGDSEGHAEAARRGWEDRGYDEARSYSRGRDRDDDDDRGYRSRGSSSSRDRGQGGWFGDPEGHSEASRRGWDERDHDDDRRYSRSRDDDDDDRGRSRGRGGHGGWSGDSEGHSEAARRGWENRR